MILRTAGANRTKAEVKRDFEYLLRMWETVRDLTLKSTAPMLVYEEGSLIKRAIRDLYNKDIDEVMVAGDDGYREAKDFMRMLMPSHAKNVKPYKDAQPLLTRLGIESQLDAMFSPVVQLRSGGYIVINQAEALVAIDVNSGRATREHHIEDTALKTNMEAAEEISRQLRLRDLAGLIVIDFIDMDEKRNNRSVERKLKECLKHDRARIQVGRISHFGLLEMSRQRIRTSVLESSTEKCSHCGGTGHVRSVASVTLQLLRSLEETLLKGATHNVIVRTRSDIALYVLNHKRAHSARARDPLPHCDHGQCRRHDQRAEAVSRSSAASRCTASRRRARSRCSSRRRRYRKRTRRTRRARRARRSRPARRRRPSRQARRAPRRDAGENGGRRRRRRRRRRPGEPAEGTAAPTETDGLDDRDEVEPAAQPAASDTGRGESGTFDAAGDAERRRRRRGRRGGRRNRRDRPDDGAPAIGGDAAVADGWQEWAQGPQADAIAPPPAPAHEANFERETAAESVPVPAPAPSRRRQSLARARARGRERRAIRIRARAAATPVDGARARTGRDRRERG